ncbi:tetratricopeptide repeat protein [Moheibacter sediminis]|uniref:Uncharacterized protein n=1 Tax=Moheibacter sediminis TaxID=1434700 RepID=A0A1W1YDA1_9FLAO|nr:hypothetical protein [Moheibacter sediminis]SMC33791.1 hypothetical protein SAMN06296427_101251 [Moheibacter sediminis]
MSQVVFVKTKLLKPIFFLIFLNFICLKAFGQNEDYESIVGKSYGDRHMFLFHNFHTQYKIEVDSAAYFKKVKKLSEVARKANDKELELEAEFLKYIFLSSRNYSKYLPEMNSLLKKVDSEQATQLQARVRQAIGFHYLYEKNNYGEAYIYLNESYPYLQQLSAKELPDKQELLYNIGYINYMIGYDAKALKFLEEAQRLDNNYYSTLECNIINTQGLIYEQSEHFDQAIKSFNQLLKVSSDNKKDIWVRVAKNNIANVLITQKKYDQALTFLNGNPQLNANDSEEIGIVIARKLMLLGKVYNAQEKWIQLSEVTPELEELLKKYNIPLKIRKEIYRLLAVDKQKKENFREAYFYKDSALILATDYFKIKNDQGLKQTLEKERIQELLKEQLKTEHQQRVTLITRVSLIVILLLIITLSIVLFIRQKEKFKKKRLEVEFELSESKAKLADLLGELKSKDREVQAYEDELEQLYQNIDKDEIQINETQKTLEALLSKPIMTENKWLVFKRSFDRVNPGYFEKLQQEIPNISPAEIRFMYLRKLNLTPKEIAYVLGISQGSIRQYKHRIRTKINADSQDKLDKFLDSI